MKLTELHLSEGELNNIIDTITEHGHSVPHYSTESYTTLMMALELKQRRAEDRQREADK